MIMLVISNTKRLCLTLNRYLNFLDGFYSFPLYPSRLIAENHCLDSLGDRLKPYLSLSIWLIKPPTYRCYIFVS